MADCFQNVHGCLLKAHELNTSVPFPTRSDALFASIFFKYKHCDLPMSLFDDLLALFRHTGFLNRDVTMQGAEDITDHIADGRRLATLDREGRLPGNSVPTLVVELVAQQVESQRTPFHNCVQSESGFTCEAETMLRGMSLVHASWTGICQRFLRRRVSVSRKGLRYSLQSPQLGPWVRELDIRPYHGYRSPKYYDVNDKDLLRLLRGVLKRCPNITHLNLSDAYPRRWVASQSVKDLEVTAFMRQLGNANLLEHLWVWHSARDDYTLSLWDLCTIIPQLRNLKSLSLENMSSHGVDELPNLNITRLLEESRPSHSLVTLSLVHVSAEDKAPLIWLTRPRADFMLRSLEISNYKSDRPTSIFAPTIHPPQADAELRSVFVCLAPALPHITKLQVHNCTVGPSFMPFVSSTTSLHCLSIWSTDMESLPGDPPLVLPASTQVLHIHLSGKINRGIWDRIHGVLAPSLHIKQVLITFPGLRERLGVGTGTGTLSGTADLKFDDVSQYCAENSVELKVRTRDKEPSILDL